MADKIAVKSQKIIIRPASAPLGFLGLDSEKFYRYLFDSSRDAIMFLKPPDWRFFSGNAATLKLFGVKTNTEFESLTPADLSPQYQPDGQLSEKKAKAMIELAMKNGSNMFDWKHKKYKGDEFSASVQLTKMEIGSEPFLQALVRDVTGQRETELSLKERALELERVNKLMVGRELKMLELKKEIDSLKRKVAKK